MEVFGLTLSVLIIVVVLVVTYKSFEKAQSLTEKLYVFILALVLLIFPIIYFLDRYNIPTKLQWAINVDTQNWLSFIGEYITGIISSIIGAVIAIWVTMYQINKNNEDNDKRDKENLRLQNMPILKYEINTNNYGNIDIDDILLVYLDKGSSYRLNINIKNVGMNTIKSMMIDLSSNVISKEKSYRILGSDSIVIIEKSEEIKIRKSMNLIPKEIYDFTVTVYYEDVLSNWYKQAIHLKYKATEEFKRGNVGSVIYEIDKEEIIKEEEINKNIL